MPTDPSDEDGDELPPAEAARARRRDHDATAGARSGMRTGLAKQFKQVLDAQVRRARGAAPRPAAGGGTDEDAGEPPAKKRGHPAHRSPPRSAPPS